MARLIKKLSKSSFLNLFYLKILDSNKNYYSSYIISTDIFRETQELFDHLEFSYNPDKTQLACILIYYFDSKKPNASSSSSSSDRSAEAAWLSREPVPAPPLEFIHTDVSEICARCLVVRGKEWNKDFFWNNGGRDIRFCLC